LSRRNLIWMGVILAAVVVMVYVTGPRPRTVPPSDPDTEALAEAIRAYRVIREKSYRAPAPAEACEGAIDGIARRVDPYCRYLRPDKAARLRRRLDGRLRETGLRVAVRGRRMVVVGPLPNSPALKAGIFAGMEVEEINGVEAKYLSAAQADKWRFDLDDDGLYYIRITEFVPGTPAAFHEAYRSLSAPRGLLLDLRGNPGGQLQMAAEIADRFLKVGQIVRTVSGEGRPYVHHAYPLGTYPPIPLVVLIDERTASAAEILAGALRIHRRALLVGRPTYGKWSVQTSVPLGGRWGTLYLTTGRYLLPNPAPATAPATTRAADDPAPLADRVVPDVDVRLTAWAARRLERLRLRAMVMPPPPDEKDPAPPAPRLRRDLLATDGQLEEAIKLLRGGEAAPRRIDAPQPQPEGEL